MLGFGAILSFLVALLALDGATYLAHRLLHQVPLLWRVHLVHHIDAAVDATTAFRQHPIEGIVRFTFIAATAWALGAPPVAIAVYRLLGALNAVLEHANIRVPPALDRALVWLWVTPDMHKVHHSRDRVETDSNYANLFSFFDRVFRTYTPSSRGPFVSYGIAATTCPSSNRSAQCSASRSRRTLPISPIGCHADRPAGSRIVASSPFGSFFASAS